MKIAFVYDAVYPYVKGGGERRYWELARRFSRKHEVHLFGMKFWKGKDVIKKEGIYLHGVCKPMELYTKEGRRSIRQALYFAFRLFPALMKEKFDIIDCGNFPFFHCFVTYFVSSIKKIQLIVTWHEYWGDYWYEYLGTIGIFGNMIEKLTTKIGNKLVVVSKLTKNKLERNGVNPKKIAVIPNGISANLIKKIKPSKKKYDVLFVGRLIKDKNVDILIRAIAKLPSVKCGIIGSGPEERSLKKIANNLGISKRVDFLGFLEEEEVYSYMKSSKTLVLPSTREGFGMVVLEANACGIPVITTSYKDNAAIELIQKGINGFIIQNTLLEFSKTITHITKGHKSYKKYCIKKASKYDWDSISERLAKIYGGLNE